MNEPVVAIVGRANVGKSTLFNYLAGSRLSIVDDTPGITRDRIYARSQWRGQDFTIVDTGGIEPRTDQEIKRAMREQAQLAIELADVIVFVTDLAAGLTADDLDIASLLHKAGRPVVVAVNKADQVGPVPPAVYEFYQLGIGDVFAISAAHRLGVGDLLDAVVDAFPDEKGVVEEDERIRIAVIGKPNVGKSSLVNYLLGESRLIVSDTPGTTRDAVDTPLDNQWGQFTLIDTAGLRRKSRIDSSVERYSMIRALSAIDRADVCLIMIDAGEGASEQDTKIAGYAHNKGKAAIFVYNKWDQVTKAGETFKQVEDEVKTTFTFMAYAPVLAMSAKTGEGVGRLFPLINQVYKNAARRLTTGVLNDLLLEAIALAPPAPVKGELLKIYYGTQVSVHPPQIALFINKKELLHFSYQRYLENQLRKYYDFSGTPIWFLLRPKTREKK